MLDGDLVIRLDAALPADVTVGNGTAVFVCGTCYSPRASTASLTLVVDGTEQPLMAHGMPRLDVLRACGVPASYRSGFWGLAQIGPRTGPAPCVLAVRARFEDGREARAELGRIAIAQPPAPVSAVPPEVAICMATYEPPLELFRRQVDTIRAQTHRDWLCVISDDCSSPDTLAAMEQVLAGDERFLLSRSPRRLGFYRNFERALSLAPADARYVAMADQDDAWHPDKLATLLAEIGAARLIYSDARIVDEDGRFVADTYWGLRRNNHEDMSALLITNAVTGAASLFPRELLDDALPFPPAQFAHFHDHWIALCARATGAIHYVDRPLYDYVQHGSAFVGHAKANRMPGLLERVASLRRDPRERLRMWRMHYFIDACRLLQFATMLQQRCGERMGASQRRALERFVRADRSVVPLGRLAVNGAREIVGQRRETLGGEWMLLHAFGWRHLLDANVRDRPQRRLRLDAVPPVLPDPSPFGHDADSAIDGRRLQDGGASGPVVRDF
jgi:glycosyltransferase involved in cell wall biosynthesis